MTIQITLLGNEIEATIASYIPNFDLYRQVCMAAGAHYVPARKANAVPMDRAADLIAGLRAAGFGLTITPEASLALVEATGSRLAAENAVLEIQAQEGLSLYGFQEVGARFLARRRKALLGDQMGLGKTVQALVALPRAAAAVVICPAAVKHVWTSETRRWRKDLTPVILRGRGSFRWPRAGEVVITNYDVLPDALPATGLQAGTVLISDEAHRLKDRKTLQTRRFRALSEAARVAGGKVWLLTGTPMLNRPPELWTVLESADLARDAFGSWTGFCRAFHAYRGAYGMEWGAPDSTVPARLVSVGLFRRREDVLPDLPLKTYRNISVNGIDPRTAAICDAAVRAMEVAGVDLAEEVQTAEAFRLDGPTFEEISRARAALAAAKVPALLEIVEEYEDAGEPVVVFSAHRAPVDVLGNRTGWGLITGDQSSEERTAAVEAFQAGRLRGLACTIQAGGVGLTLTKAAHVLFVDRAWTPALNVQAEDRVCRIGQTRGVVVTTLVAAHALDERVTEVLLEKERLIAATIDAAVGRAPVVMGGVGTPLDLDSIRQELVRPAAPVEERGNGTTSREETAIPNGYFTVILDDGDHVTLRVRVASEKSALRGKRIVSYLAGPENTSDYVGCGFVGEDGVRLWKRFQGSERLARALAILAKDPGAAGKGYALRSGNCYVCGRLLTVPESIQRGIGPECAGRMV